MSFLYFWQYPICFELLDGDLISCNFGNTDLWDHSLRVIIELGLFGNGGFIA